LRGGVFDGCDAPAGGEMSQKEGELQARGRKRAFTTEVVASREEKRMDEKEERTG
jgi:hypothetical protein